MTCLTKLLFFIVFFAGVNSDPPNPFESLDRFLLLSNYTGPNPFDSPLDNFFDYLQSKINEAFAAPNPYPPLFCSYENGTEKVPKPANCTEDKPTFYDATRNLACVFNMTDSHPECADFLNYTDVFFNNFFNQFPLKFLQHLNLRNIPATFLPFFRNETDIVRLRNAVRAIFAQERNDLKTTTGDITNGSVFWNWAEPTVKFVMGYVARVSNMTENMKNVSSLDRNTIQAILSHGFNMSINITGIDFEGTGNEWKEGGPALSWLSSTSLHHVYKVIQNVIGVLQVQINKWALWYTPQGIVPVWKNHTLDFLNFTDWRNSISNYSNYTYTIPYFTVPWHNYNMNITISGNKIELWFNNTIRNLLGKLDDNGCLPPYFKYPKLPFKSIEIPTKVNEDGFPLLGIPPQLGRGEIEVEKYLRTWWHDDQVAFGNVPLPAQWFPWNVTAIIEAVFGDAWKHLDWATLLNSAPNTILVAKQMTKFAWKVLNELDGHLPRLPGAAKVLTLRLDLIPGAPNSVENFFDDPATNYLTFYNFEWKKEYFEIVYNIAKADGFLGNYLPHLETIYNLTSQSHLIGYKALQENIAKVPLSDKFSNCMIQIWGNDYQNLWVNVSLGQGGGGGGANTTGINTLPSQNVGSRAQQFAHVSLWTFVVMFCSVIFVFRR